MPDNAERLLVYDGDCGFCTTWAGWIETRWGGTAGASAVPSQRLDEAGLQRLGLTPADVARSAWWVDGDKRFADHLAVARALIAAGGHWGLVGRLLLVPPVRWFCALGYRVVARNRSRLPGGTPTCTA